MPKLDLILLPLLGGYWFLSTLNYTKFYHQRVEKQRLIFNSLIAGFFLSALGVFIDNIFLKSCPFIRNILGEIIPFNYEGLNLSILIFLISYPIAFLINLRYDENSILDAVIQEWADDYEKLFWTSLKEKDDKDKLIMITTDKDKVYVGYVNQMSKPLDNVHVTIIPYFSGYRDKDTKVFVITTNYSKTLKNFVDEGKEEQIDKKIGIIIPKEKITSASRFDLIVFDKFQEDLEQPIIEKKPKRDRKPKPKE